MIAEAIFNSKIRYGVAVFLNPVYNEEDLKMKKFPKNTTALQTLQNNMIRVILKIDKKKHINMMHIREKINMMSVNQISIYPTLFTLHFKIKKLSMNSQRNYNSVLSTIHHY